METDGMRGEVMLMKAEDNGDKMGAAWMADGVEGMWLGVDGVGTFEVT